MGRKVAPQQIKNTWNNFRDNEHVGAQVFLQNQRRQQAQAQIRNNQFNQRVSNTISSLNPKQIITNPNNKIGRGIDKGGAYLNKNVVPTVSRVANNVKYMPQGLKIAAQSTMGMSGEELLRRNPDMLTNPYLEPKAVAGTFFDVATIPAAPAVSLSKSLAAKVGTSAAKKLAAYGALRGTEAMTMKFGRDLSQGEGVKTAIKNTPGSFVAGAGFNTALSPILATKAIIEGASKVGSKIVPAISSKLASQPAGKINFGQLNANYKANLPHYNLEQKLARVDNHSSRVDILSENYPGKSRGELAKIDDEMMSLHMSDHDRAMVLKRATQGTTDPTKVKINKYWETPTGQKGFADFNSPLSNEAKTLNLDTKMTSLKSQLESVNKKISNNGAPAGMEDYFQVGAGFRTRKAGSVEAGTKLAKEATDLQNKIEALENDKATYDLYKGRLIDTENALETGYYKGIDMRDKESVKRLTKIKKDIELTLHRFEQKHGATIQSSSTSKSLPKNSSLGKYSDISSPQLEQTVSPADVTRIGAPQQGVPGKPPYSSVIDPPFNTQSISENGVKVNPQPLSTTPKTTESIVTPVGTAKTIKVRTYGNGEGKNVKVKLNALDDVAPESIKDITSIDASFKSVYRNFEKAFGNKFQDVKRRILDPFDASKGAMVEEQSRLAQGLKTTIVDGLGIKKGSKESALVQMYGEGKIDIPTLRNQVGDVKAQDIVNADSWFRSQYNTLLDEVNAVRARIYPNNPDKQIPKRQDYYRHFQEMTGIEGLRNVFDTPSGIPNEMGAISYQTKPNSKFLSFAQKRTGDKTKYDAVGGFLDYMRSATYAKHIDPQVKIFRNLANEIAQTSESGQARLTQYVNQFADDLSGKTNPGDRWLQDTFGRGTMKGINWLNSRVKANVILGNLSSTVAQAGNTPQMMAKAGYRNWAGGFKDVLTPGNRAIDGSDFIKERYSNSIFDQFDTKLLDQPKKAAIWITQSLDELATKIGWNGFYRQAIEKGIQNPIKYADDMARSMVGGRGIGEVPLAQKAKATQLVAPFMLEVQNLMQVLGKEASNKEIGVLLKYALAAYGFNQAAKVIRGNGVTFDPVQAVVDATKAYQEEDNKGVGAIRAGGRIAGEVLSNTMGGQQLASLYPEYGLKIPGTEENVTRKELFGSKDPTRFGSGLITSAVQNPLYKVLPSFGGSQLQKTIEGATAYSKGYVENKGKEIQYMVDKNPVNLAKSLAFGKYATNNAREYFDKKRTAVGEKDSNLIKLGAKKYNDVMTERDQNKTLDKLKEGKNVKGSEFLGDGLYKVGDKYYSKTLDQEFKSEKLAKEALSKDQFSKSNKKSELIDGTYYYKNKNGDVQTMSEDDFNMKVSTARIEQAYDSGNYKEYVKLANEKLAMIKSQYENADPLTQIELQNDYNDLQAKLEKYAGYGGSFKKTKKTVYKPIKFESISNSTPKFTYKVRSPKKYAIKSKLVKKPRLT